MNRKNVFLMYGIALLQGMVFYAPIATLYRQAQGVTIFQITLIESICLALCLVLEIPWGVVADKIGYRRTMIVCSILYFISKIVFWQATGFGTFLLERIILAVVHSGMSGVDTSILYLSCGEAKSHHTFGIYEGLGGGGLMVSSLVFAGFIGTNYPLAGFLTAVSYGVAMVVALFLDEVSPADKKSSRSGDTLALFRMLFSNKVLVVFLIALAFFNETHQTVTVLFSQLQYVACGISPSGIGTAYILVTVAGLCGVFSSGATEKIGVGTSAGLYFAVAILSCGVLAFTQSAVVSVLCIVGLRLAYCLFQPLQQELQNQQVITSNRATELSIHSALTHSVGICTNLVFGRIAQASLPSAFGAGAVLTALGAVLFLIWYRARVDSKTP